MEMKYVAGSLKKVHTRIHIKEY